MTVLEILRQPWPWWVAGPLIGLTVPLLLLYGGKAFGISSSLRHACAATVPTRLPFFDYDWRARGGWNLAFVFGVVLGGVLAATLLASPQLVIGLSDDAWQQLAALGIEDRTGLVPNDLISWRALATVPGFIVIVGGGFLVGFGARWAGGCTSGHAITGLANLQLPSLLAVLGFFAGGLAVTWWLLPWLLS